MKNKKIQFIKVYIKDICFSVEIAKTLIEHVKGLMFRKHLDQDKGMLFIFKKEKRHRFWMKNIFMPLDIIWIDKDKEIVFISKNVQPCKSFFCHSVTPDKKAKYVLELNSGISDKLNLSIGDKCIFEIKDF